MSVARPIIAFYLRFRDIWIYIYIYIYICLSARELRKTVHTLCKFYHVGPLCIWNTVCCLEHHFEESTTLRSRPFARYGRRRQFSWRQPGRRQQLRPYAYSYRTQEAQHKPDCGTKGRTIGSWTTSAYSFLYYFIILYSTCHKKLYEICGLSASEIHSFSAALPRISAESCKGVRGIEQGCPRNRARVSAESCKGVRGIVKGCPRNHERVSADL